MQQEEFCRHLQLRMNVGASANMRHNFELHFFRKYRSLSMCTLQVEFRRHLQNPNTRGQYSRFLAWMTRLDAVFWQSWQFHMAMQVGNHGHWPRPAVILCHDRWELSTWLYSLWVVPALCRGGNMLSHLLLRWAYSFQCPIILMYFWRPFER